MAPLDAPQRPTPNLRHRDIPVGSWEDDNSPINPHRYLRYGPTECPTSVLMEPIRDTLPLRSR
ncbi:hypothetical protein DPMN_038313 [Dreissena polymorpha]|uniref:Uncharacterized protein n=1 Tax=Dreissena polymorpha TaxID=45954 RepID=A0A9D4RQ33_DREPO|nr:hypothetical protein DPMN_038313 [Dreissena polymorpha]